MKKRLAGFFAIAALVMMVACADMTAPDFTPQFDLHEPPPPVGRCRPGMVLVYRPGSAVDRNGDGWICNSAGETKMPDRDNSMALGPDLPPTAGEPIICGGNPPCLIADDPPKHPGGGS